MSPWANAADAVAYIQSRQRFGIRPGLERTESLLQALGHPERALRFVHVAGTNGKGSTCAYLDSVLRAAGYRVGLYTSPYLMAFCDRMSVDGDEISDQELLEITWQVKEAVDRLPADDGLAPTEFEVTTAIALLYFKCRAVDVVVLETGLGGRYDATNVVTPEVSVITNVALDHTHILGDHVEQIAADKAGIIKQGKPVVTAVLPPALRIVQEAAHRQGSRVFSNGRDFRSVCEEDIGMDGQRFSFFGRQRDYLGLRIGLLGPHQVQNAGVALAALQCLQDSGFTISAAAVRQGMRSAHWPGRLEIIRRDPVIVLDGAHNPAGANALVEALPHIGVHSYVLVIGIFADKDVEGILRSLTARATHIVVTAPQHTRALPIEELARKARRCVSRDTAIEKAESVAMGLARAETVAKTRATASCIVVAGSLYTVAEARQALM